MSCSALCPCQFNWPVDTLGHKRDPVNSEKAWLDFAVRSLSREAVGKGRGQETVWNSACRPAWWDAEVGLAWKNPTANPKDTKEVLLQKYEALEHHLKVEGRFPKELEEEARLWSEGKYKELFLLTSFTSLLGKVTGLHSAVLAASTRAVEMKAEMNQDLIQDIKMCLSSTLSAIANMNTSGNTSAKKRTHAQMDQSKSGSHSGKENCSHSLKKLKKILPSPHEPTCGEKVVSGNKVKVSHGAQSTLTKCTKGNATKISSAICQQRSVVRNSVTSKQANLPSLTSQGSFSSKSKPDSRATTVEPLLDEKSPNPVVVQISQEEFDRILQGNVFTLPLPVALENPVDYLLDNSGSENEKSALSPSDTSFCSDISQLVCSKTIQSVSSYSTDNVVSEAVLSNVLDHSESLSNNLVSVSHASSPISSGDCLLADSSVSPEFVTSFQSAPVNVPVSSIAPCGILYPASPCGSGENQAVTPGRGSPASIPGSEMDVGSNFETSFPLTYSSSSRVSSGRVGSSNSHHGSAVTDAGYGSDEGRELDLLDTMFNQEEQDQLWREDGSVLLDKFLDSF